MTSPLWNFPGAYSLEFDIAEREEWYSQNTSAVLPIASLPFVPAQHSQYNAQKPKFSVRWQPLDPKWIGALTLRGSYSEAFHAPTLPDFTCLQRVRLAFSIRFCTICSRRRGTLYRKPQPKAGSRLRMDLWSGLQPEMDQGSYTQY